MKRSKSQLNAISRAYQENQRKGQEKILIKYNLVEDWSKSKYKNLTWYLLDKFHKGILKKACEVYGREA